jgi:hypothetical protein
MNASIDSLFADEPTAWITILPDYQRSSITQLVAGGKSFDEVAQAWLTASASNTYRFGAVAPVGPKNAFLEQVKVEVRAYLCGDDKYEKERAGLFGDGSTTRTVLVSWIALAIAPHVGVAVAVLTPVVALVLASFGKITINAWCASTAPGPQQPTT